MVESLSGCGPGVKNFLMNCAHENEWWEGSRYLLSYFSLHVYILFLLVKGINEMKMI